jgi:hypothetical protein
MASITDLLMQMAAQQAQTEQVKTQNAYAPQIYEADISHKNALTSKIPSEIALTQMQTRAIPSEIRARLALAALHDTERQYVPTKYDIERLKTFIERDRADVYQRLNSPDRLELQDENTRSLINYRNSPGAMNRGLSPVAKIQADIQRAEEEGDTAAAEQLKAQAQKQANDVQFRRQAVEFNNALKTYDTVDINAISKFAGPMGAVNYWSQKKLAQVGLPASEDFQKAHKFLTVTLPYQAGDIRRAMKDSITPEMQHILTSLSNPLENSANPELAISNWNELGHLMKQQAQTYYEVIDKPVKAPVIKDEPVVKDKKVNKVYSEEDIRFTAKKHGVSEAEVRKRLKARK